MQAGETAVLDATAHALKFIGFQEMYFENSFPPEYGITPKEELMNAPRRVLSPEVKAELSAQEFTVQAAQAVAGVLGLQVRERG